MVTAAHTEEVVRQIQQISDERNAEINCFAGTSLDQEEEQNYSPIYSTLFDREGSKTIHIRLIFPTLSTK